MGLNSINIDILSPDAWESLEIHFEKAKKLDSVDIRIKFYDTENKGLVLEMFPSGAKFFRTIKRDDSPNRLITVAIGEFPQLA